jgi:hypothetical protein
VQHTRSFALCNNQGFFGGELAMFVIEETLHAFLMRKEKDEWRLVEHAAPLYLLVHPAGRKMTLVTRVGTDHTEYVYKVWPGNLLGTGSW